MVMDVYPALLIPVYQPSKRLIRLVRALRALTRNQRIIVVDDGSRKASAAIFSRICDYDVELLRHDYNRGKGEALKTGFKYWLETTSTDATGIVTADADGQHLPRDILNLSAVFSENPSFLYLGIRKFDKYSMPWRSRVGNKLTRFILRSFTKASLRDTQTGLRAIPRRLVLNLLSLKSSGYEFEFEMLLIAEENKVTFREIPIRTVYFDDNKASHFNPLIDSIKIYFVFIRFTAISLLSAVVDFLLFSLTYQVKKNVFLAVVVGRVLSSTLNFTLNHHIAFKSQHKLLPAAIKYAGLVSFLGLLAYGFITLLHNVGINIYSSKILAEITLFLLSFTVQRLFIFHKKSVPL